MAVTCANCGQLRAEDDAFCGFCGTSAMPVISEPQAAEAVVADTVLTETVLADTVLAETVRVPVVTPPAPPGAPPGAALPLGAPGPSPGAHPGAPGLLPAVPEPLASDGRVPNGAVPGGAGGGHSRNATYTGHRLQYERTPETSFDPLVNRRFLICPWRQAAVFFTIYTIGAFITGIPVFILSLLGLFFLGIIWNVCAVIIAIGLFIAFLVIPVPALLSEWKYLIDDKGAAWQATLGHIYSPLHRPPTPLNTPRL